MLESFNRPPYFNGLADFEIDLGFTGDDEESILSSLNGRITIRGENLVLLGADLDEIITNFERSQQFTLVDIGALAIAGYAGLAITKGGDYANILIFGIGDTTKISMINSSIVVEKRKIMLDDVAFATKRQRVAVMGHYDTFTDSIDFRVSVLDKKGCSLIEQALLGSLDDPEQSKIGIISTLLGPIKNLLQDAELINCEIVYEGVVPHPELKD